MLIGLVKAFRSGCAGRSGDLSVLNILDLGIAPLSSICLGWLPENIGNKSIMDIKLFTVDNFTELRAHRSQQDASSHPY
ncbi:MAG: hypothetical protein GW822_15560 [Sphingomonadales bacterium]|nr:hypothetical protein [Sphingomonadales bacterium]